MDQHSVPGLIPSVIYGSQAIADYLEMSRNVRQAWYRHLKNEKSDGARPIARVGSHYVFDGETAMRTLLECDFDSELKMMKTETARK